MRRYRPRGTTTSGGLRPRPRRRGRGCAIALPTPLIRIATGIGQAPRDRLDRRGRAPASLSSGFTASSRSRITRSAPASRALAIARGLLAGRNSTDRRSKSDRLMPIFLPPARLAAPQYAAHLEEINMLTHFPDRHRRPGPVFRDDRASRSFTRAIATRSSISAASCASPSPGFNFVPPFFYRVGRKINMMEQVRRHPGPGDHHQGQCHGRGRRRGVLPGARRGQGGL